MGNTFRHLAFIFILTQKNSWGKKKQNQNQSKQVLEQLPNLFFLWAVKMCLIYPEADSRYFVIIREYVLFNRLTYMQMNRA